jgi:hypothetical protein
MSTIKPGAPSKDWKGYQKIGFRIAFIFFLIQCIPTNLAWYKTLFSINWLNLHYRDLYDVARFNPHFVTIRSESGRWGIASYADWGVILLVAIAGAIIWTAFDRKRKEYNNLYYWLRVIVRYRAAIGIIGFGFTKLLPVQMPYPSISLLNNNFGDLTGHKVFWLSIGIVPWYQVFTGIVEVGAGTLLFFRSTAAFGAALLIGALATITVVNLGYDGGVHGYASYFVLLGAFILAHYVPSIYNLLIRERFTIPVNYYPSFAQKWQRITRFTLKAGVIVLFIGVLFYLQLVNFLYDPYKQPSAPGVASLRGYYNVTEFRINNKVIPYSPVDTVRWQEATFEKWTTLTYKVNKKVKLDLANGGGGPMKDIDKSFEVSGVAGGRRVFHYYADTVNQTLYLQDKNNASLKGRGRGEDAGEAADEKPAKKIDSSKFWIPKAALVNIGDENKTIYSRASSARRDKAFASGLKDDGRNKMILKYSTYDGSRVILTGIDEHKDSLYVILDRVDKKYALSESSLVAGKYNK